MSNDKYFRLEKNIRGKWFFIIPSKEHKGGKILREYTTKRAANRDMMNWKEAYRKNPWI